MADCAGVAGLAALAHFKRPDVTLDGDIVTVRTVIIEKINDTKGLTS